MAGIRGSRTAVFAPGSAAMTAAHRTRECYTRCVLRLARLRLLAGDGAGDAAAARCGRRSGPRGPGDRGRNRRRRASRRGRRRGSRRSSVAVFLAARQARLAAAADEVAAAAQDGSAAALSRPLRRFEALTTALRTVQPGLRPAWPAPARAPGGTGSRMRTPDRGPAASGS